MVQGSSEIAELEQRLAEDCDYMHFMRSLAHGELLDCQELAVREIASKVVKEWVCSILTRDLSTDALEIAADIVICCFRNYNALVLSFWESEAHFQDQGLGFLISELMDRASSICIKFLRELMGNKDLNFVEMLFEHFRRLMSRQIYQEEGVNGLHYFIFASWKCKLGELAGLQNEQVFRVSKSQASSLPDLLSLFQKLKLVCRAIILSPNSLVLIEGLLINERVAGDQKSF